MRTRFVKIGPKSVVDTLRNTDQRAPMIDVFMSENRRVLCLLCSSRIVDVSRENIIFSISVLRSKSRAVFR